jgi:hypothetical protein
VTVTCDPAIPAADFGLTTFPVGSMPTVQLAPTICLGDFLFDAPAGYLAQVRYLNPTLNVDWTIGVGVLVTVHEAQHAHGWYSETQAECRAMQIVSKLLAGRPGPLAMAELYDSRLPAAYHDGSTCSLESL